MLIDLKWNIAKLENNKLVIVSPSDNSAGYHTPADSVTIFGKESLIALRDALNEAYPVEEIKS